MGNISVLILLIYFLSDSSTFSPLWDKFNPNLLGSIKKLFKFVPIGSSPNMYCVAQSIQTFIFEKK